MGADAAVVASRIGARIDAIEAGSEVPPSEARDMAREIRYLRDAVRSARNEVMCQLASIVAHVHENARGLAKYGDVAANEARCRELTAMYLDEALECLRYDDEAERFDGVQRRLDRLAERIGVSLSELDAIGEGSNGDG